MYFNYGSKEIEYLTSQDSQFGKVIDKIGHINRKVDSDLFSSVIHKIIGQQISTRAQETVWDRFAKLTDTVNPENICSINREDLQKIGITYRKADYILEFSDLVYNGLFDIDALKLLPDNEVIISLTAIRGIGRWTAEMILLFCMQRPDIISYDDLAIQRGMRMLYHHRQMTPELFSKYRKRYSPYGSVASLYLWAIAGGAVTGMKDYAPTGRIKHP